MKIAGVCIYQAPVQYGSKLSTFRGLSCFILIKARGGSNRHCAHFIAEATEAQRGRHWRVRDVTNAGLSGLGLPSALSARALALPAQKGE